MIGAFFSYHILTYQTKAAAQKAMREYRKSLGYDDDDAAPETATSTISDTSAVHVTAVDVAAPGPQQQKPVATPEAPPRSNMIKNIMSLNYKKGLLRIWIVATLVWMPYSIYQDWELISYTFSYHTNYAGIRNERDKKINDEIESFKKAKLDISKQTIVPLRYREPLTDNIGLISAGELWNSIHMFTSNPEWDRKPEAMQKAFLRDTEEYTRKKAKSLIAIVDHKISILELVLKNLTIDKPDYYWIFRAFVLPLLLIPIAVLCYFVAMGGFIIFRWIGSGFTR